MDVLLLLVAAAARDSERNITQAICGAGCSREGGYRSDAARALSADPAGPKQNLHGTHGLQHSHSSGMMEPTSMPNELMSLGRALFGQEQLQQLIQVSKRTTRRITSGGQVYLHTAQEDGVSWSANDEYQLERLSHAPADSVVVDIGANIGDTAIQLYRANPGLRILSLEPVPETYFFMRWNLHANGVPLLRKEDFAQSSGGVLALFGGASRDGRNVSMAYKPNYSKKASMFVRSANDSPKDMIIPTYNIPKLLNSLHADAELPLLKIECASRFHCRTLQLRTRAENKRDGKI